MEEQASNQRSFKELLKELYLVDGNKKVEVSFTSKLLSVVNPNLPIWDQFVLEQIGLTEEWDNVDKLDYETRIDVAGRIYNEMIELYESFINSEEGQKSLKVFDNSLPKYKNILTNTKKIDCILWSKDR